MRLSALFLCDNDLTDRNSEEVRQDDEIVEAWQRVSSLPLEDCLRRVKAHQLLQGLHTDISIFAQRCDIGAGTDHVDYR